MFDKVDQEHYLNDFQIQRTERKLMATNSYKIAVNGLRRRHMP